jgi:hypothetical protein
MTPSAAPAGSDERRARLWAAAQLVVGLVLVANALFGAVTAGGDRYRYDSLELTVEDGDLAFGEDSPVDQVPDRIQGIDCLFDTPHSRLCASETWLMDTQGSDGSVSITAEDPGNVYPEDRPPSYAYHDGAIYERSWDASPGTGSATLGLERVPTREALGDVARDASELSPRLRQAVTDGPVTTGDRLDADGLVVSTDDGHVILVAEQSRRERPLMRAGSRLLSLAVGAALTLRGWRSFRTPTERAFG